jgi:hypothetical protein
MADGGQLEPGANVTISTRKNPIWRFILTNADIKESALVTRSLGQI